MLCARRGCCPFLLFSLRKNASCKSLSCFLSSCSFLLCSLRKMQVANLRLGPGALALRGTTLVNPGVFPERASERANERGRARARTHESERRRMSECMGEREREIERPVSTHTLSLPVSLPLWTTTQAFLYFLCLSAPPPTHT